MIGYHYTSLENWKKIRKQGLKPYPITNEQFKLFNKDNPKTIDAVWLWTRRFEGKPHIGAILYQFATKNDMSIVHLECEWYWHQQARIMDEDGEMCPFELGHEGTIGLTTYHDPDIHKSRLINETIPPKRIKLLKVYDLEELLK